MIQRRALIAVHIISTAWFVLCVAYIMVYVLRQADVEWWVIFSLTGHSAVMVFLFLSIYLFAFYRGVARSVNTEQEHPISQQISYMLLYYLSPFLGTVAGFYAMLGVALYKEFFLGVAVATFWATFLVWIVLDPLISLTEMLFPASRTHRRARLAQAKALRAQKQQEREQLLARLEREEKYRQGQLRLTMEPLAARLAAILTNRSTKSQQKQFAAVELGVQAWQLGRLEGMKLLHEMSRERTGANSEDSPGWIDFISRWWDGIGSWTYEPFLVKGRMELV
jgi:Ca2+/Na+ antiporter